MGHGSMDRSEMQASDNWYPDAPWDSVAEHDKEIKIKIQKRLHNLNGVYHCEMSKTVDIYVGNEKNTPHGGVTGNSQYIALYIVKKDTGDVVKLRMKTARKIFKFLVKKAFVPNPRRWTWWEKFITKVL